MKSDLTSEQPQEIEGKIKEYVNTRYKKGESNLTEHVSYPVLTRCNLSCVGCTTYSEHSESSASLTPVTNWREELKLLKDKINPAHLGITGGETLMHPEIEDIVKFAIDNFDNVNLTTNGLLLDKNPWLWDLIVDTRYTDYRGFSLTVSLHNDISVNSKYASIINEPLLDLITQKTQVSYDYAKAMIGRASAGEEITHNLLFSVLMDSKDILKVHNINLVIRLAGNYWLHPHLNSDTMLPLPFNNEPDEAHKECVCPLTHYKDKKLYKCTVTTFLPAMLKAKGNIDDWPHLKEFKPYDLVNPGDDVFMRLRKPEDVCRHCPVASKNQWVRNQKQDLKSKLFIIKSSGEE